MGFSRVLSAVLQGLEVKFVQVEADLSNGLPMFHMVGYLSSEVKEAGERVRTAIRNSGILLPAKRTVINLSPGNVRKTGASFDLPIAVAILASLGYVDAGLLEDTLMVGELCLDGTVRGVNGVLPIVAEAGKLGCKNCILPLENGKEGTLAGGIRIWGVRCLKEVYDYLTHRGQLREIASGKPAADVREEIPEIDFRDIKGQKMVKRAAEVAAAGGHNFLMTGPPGSGKSMIAKAVSAILPPMSMEESMKITKIYSVMGMLDCERPLIRKRPFREVHHTATRTAVAGGGNHPRPGEITLASGGVLFLDELTEFSKPVLEILRQPLEERVIRISRKQGTYVFPADFMLVAAANPCPCGYYPDRNRCRCTPFQIRQYLGKISQPLLSRIDVCMETQKIDYDALRGKNTEESSGEIRKRVERAREIQKMRYRGKEISVNAALRASDLEEYCRLQKDGEALMRQAYDSLELTARTYHRILKVARTIADLEGEENIGCVHLKEAIGYRMMDKKYWRSI